MLFFYIAVYSRSIPIGLPLKLVPIQLTFVLFVPSQVCLSRRSSIEGFMYVDEGVSLR